MRPFVTIGVAFVLVGTLVVGSHLVRAAREPDMDVPQFRVDPAWPKPLPNNWALGNIGGVTVDAEDHIWIAHRPGRTSAEDRFAIAEPPIAECCGPAPPVIEFDQSGVVIQAWGPVHDEDGKLIGPQAWQAPAGLDWPQMEHAIFVHRNQVWLSNSNAPSQILKFTRDGKLLQRLGSVDAKSNDDLKNFGGPAGVVVDSRSDELFVADGYRNKRIAVFDAATGAYKRHWGAYGEKPSDEPQGRYNPDSRRSRQFATAHCVRLSNDDLVYVCDRSNNRIQVFSKSGAFVAEELVAPRTLGFGSVGDIAFSADSQQRFLYVADGTNKKVWILDRMTLKTIGSFGHGGREAGGLAIAHAIASDSKGNVYVGESRGGDRVQRFLYVGMRRTTNSK